MRNISEISSISESYRSKSSGGTSRKGLQMARAALLTKPSITGRDSSADRVVFQSVRSRWTACTEEHSSLKEIDRKIKN